MLHGKIVDEENAIETELPDVMSSAQQQEALKVRQRFVSLSVNSAEMRVTLWTLIKNESVVAVDGIDQVTTNDILTYIHACMLPTAGLHRLVPF